MKPIAPARPAALLSAAALFATVASAQHERGHSLECGYLWPAEYLDHLRASVERGLVRAPSERVVPPIATGAIATGAVPVGADGAPGQPGCITRNQLHPFEDTDGVAFTFQGVAELLDLMVDGANDLLSVWGDRFDIIGFFFNDAPLGAGPFYAPVKNDVLGIGDPSGMGTPIFDFHASLGLGGTRTQGLLLMGNVHFLEPGNAPAADLTRLTLAQELEHRFALYLPDLLDGRRMQGVSPCGRGAHWNWKVDGQGSGMEISEWTGSNPANLVSKSSPVINLIFNTDTGGAFSYPDLYLMGYVSAAELDAGASELRYMNDADCSATYSGAITTFSSADVVAAAGARVPDSSSSQKDFRVGWVMIHQTGDPPDAADLDRAVGVLRQNALDWEAGTLGRGTIDHTLYDECGKIRRFGGPVNPAGTILVPSVASRPDGGRRVTLALDNPLGTQAPGSLPVLYVSRRPLPEGRRLPGLGLRGGGSDGELLISLARADRLARLVGEPWSGPGRPVLFELDPPADPALLPAPFYVQGVFLDPSPASALPVALTEALAIELD